MNFSTETPKNVKKFKKHILFLFSQILSKFEEEEEGWVSRERREECGIGLWKTIKECWKISNHVLDFFFGAIVSILSFGRMIAAKSRHLKIYYQLCFVLLPSEMPNIQAS